MAKKSTPGSIIAPETDRPADQGAADGPSPSATAVLTARPVASLQGGQQLLDALKTLKRGEFRVRLPVDETITGSAIAEAFNEVAELIEHNARETDRIARAVGKEGRISQRAATAPRSAAGPIRSTR